jgi:hypothetical protein
MNKKRDTSSFQSHSEQRAVFGRVYDPETGQSRDFEMRTEQRHDPRLREPHKETFTRGPVPKEYMGPEGNDWPSRGTLRLQERRPNAPQAEDFGRNREEPQRGFEDPRIQERPSEGSLGVRPVLNENRFDRIPDGPNVRDVYQTLPNGEVIKTRKFTAYQQSFEGRHNSNGEFELVETKEKQRKKRRPKFFCCIF